MKLSNAFLISGGFLACQVSEQGAVEAFSTPNSKISGFQTQHNGIVVAHALKSNQNTNEQEPAFLNKDEISNRRQAMGAIISAALVSGFVVQPASAVEKPLSFNPSVSYEKTFPIELDTVDADIRSPKRKALEEYSASRANTSPLDNSPKDLISGAVLWGSALWFLAGSRSNPLVTPLANLVYDSNDEEWLRDRNDGLFAALPVPFLLFMGLVFVGLGFGVHLAAISLAEGSIAISLQLAGVLLIGAGALEIGRIASGEKKQTRDDFDRDSMLEQEFDDFARSRLKPGGNCHRSEVVAAFRRFHAKYRQADNPDYPLNDLEIEQLLKQWNDKYAGAQRSSAGFYTGIQINTEADIVLGAK